MAKVKVRIAVAVDPEGDWVASGSKSVNKWIDNMDYLLDHLHAGEARYWVEAELEVPDAQEVQGTVSIATKDA
jgi:hypothetical protein